MKYLLIFFLFFSGCAIPLEIRNKIDPIELAWKERIHKEEKLEKKRYNGRIRIEKLKQIRLQKKQELRKTIANERNLILQSFRDSDIILKSFEKMGISIFDIAVFLNEYGKADIDGFCDFLETKHPFNNYFRWALDRDVFIPVKRNYYLLKKLYE